MDEYNISILRLSPPVAAMAAWGTMLAQGLKWNKRMFLGRSASLLSVYIATTLVVDGAALVAERWQNAKPGRHPPIDSVN